MGAGEGAAAYRCVMNTNGDGLLKSGRASVPPHSAPTHNADEGTDSKRRRVAKFLILVGSERAAEIFSRLDGVLVEQLSREISTIKAIGAEEGAAVLEEFRSLLSSPFGYAGSVSGGIEAARRLLYAAYGPEKGERILVRALPEAKANPFDFLEDFSGDQLALLLREEPPSAIAVILSQLSPKLSAAAIASISSEKKLETIRRIARHAPIAPEVLERIAGALREKARHIGGAKNDGFDGMNALAAILKSADASFGDQIIRELEYADPNLGHIIKERVYTLDDIISAVDLPIQKKLASMDNREIVLLLKARTKQAPAGKAPGMKPGEDPGAAAFREKMLSNMSQDRRADIITEEEITGAVPRRDVERAASAFLSWFRQSREEGSILMYNDKDIVR